MFRDQTFGTKTSETITATSKTDINQKSLNRYRDYMSRFNPDVNYNQFDKEEFLNKLRILENGNCTYGGILFLGNRLTIEKYFLTLEFIFLKSLAILIPMHSPVKLFASMNMKTFGSIILNVLPSSVNLWILHSTSRKEALEWSFSSDLKPFVRPW